MELVSITALQMRILSSCLGHCEESIVEGEGFEMRVVCDWQEKMKFTAQADSHQVMMDARSPIGSDSALSPKQLLLASICGCTAMDVVAFLKKFRQPVESLQVEAQAETTEGGYPVIFKEVKLLFKLQGELDGAKVMEAVRLSQTKYCGVSAMVSKAVPISYTIEVNQTTIGSGAADFN